MKRYALAAVAAIALASSWTATAAQTPITAQSIRAPEPPARCLLPSFQSFSAEVWAPHLWKRGAPPKATVAAAHRRIGCAPGSLIRGLMKGIWKADRADYLAHRRGKIADRRYLDAVDPPGLAVLSAIAACESGGDPTAVDPSGTYRGKYQFDYETWASVGGSGDPAAAPEREQDERAAALYRSRGPAPWPRCGV